MTDLAARDARFVWHPYTNRAAAGPPVPIARGDGAYLVTTDGQRLFDAISSWWVTLHGHAHPHIAAAIALQAELLEQVIFAGFTHEPAAHLAERLAAITPPSLTRAFYTDDGSTAVEAALKMALQWWRIRGERRSLVVAFEHAYHGDTFGAMSVSGRGPFTESFGELLFEVARIPDPSSGDALGALDALLDRRGGDCAALILEPLLLGAGGMRMYPADALAALCARARAAGVPVIADEVLTGFGRTGPMFACEHAGVEPDLMCLSKGLTGGFLPLGVTMVSDAIHDAFDGDGTQHTLYHGHSFTANPLACTAALASLSLMDDECHERRRAIQRAHEDGLVQLPDDGRVCDRRVLGTVAAFDLAGDAGYLSGAAGGLAAFARERGVLLRPLGNVVYMLPPYCTTADDLEHAWGVVGEWLDRG